MADPEPTDEVSQGQNDHEISVRHRASGHVYKFTINGAGLAPEPTIAPNTETVVVAESLKAAARHAALEFLARDAALELSRRDDEQFGPRPPEGWPPRPPDGWTPADWDWMPADDAADQVSIQAHVYQRRRFVAATSSEAIWNWSPPPNLAINPPSVGTPQPIIFAEAVATEARVGGLSSPADIEAIIPPQASGGSQFRLDESGRIDLVPDPPANTDKGQQELYVELRRKTLELSGLGDNQLGDLFGPITIFLDALPENIEALSIRCLWSRGNALRRKLSAHDIAFGSNEPNFTRLPPFAAEPLRDLVETFNVYINGEPEGRKLDQVRRGPQERDADRAIVNAFKPIVQALRASPDVATPRAVETLIEQNEAAQDTFSAASVDTDQAVALAGKSDSNTAIEALRSGAAWLVRGAADDVKSGFYRDIGSTAAKVAIGGTVAASLAVAVFIANHAAALKGFVDVAFHDPALGLALRRIIDEIMQAVSSMPPIGP